MEDTQPSQTQEEDDNIWVPKCVKRGCRSTENLLLCSATGCGRSIHRECYLAQQVITNKMKPLEGTNVACSKKCYLRVKTATTRRPTWSTDGKHGPDDPNNSERILLNWLTYPSNYTKFRGKGNNGTTKLRFAQIIAAKMNAAEVKIPRDAKQVLNKMKHLEDTFRRAYDFANSETGAGCKEAGTFEEEVQKTCPVYFDLLPIMSDRASAKPKSLSDDLGLSSDEEDLLNYTNSSDSDGKPHAVPRNIDTLNEVESDKEDKQGKDDDMSLSSSARSARSRKSSEQPSSASSTKKKARLSITPTKSSSNMISLLDKETSEQISALAKKKMEAVEWQNKNNELDYKEKESDYKMRRLTRLKTIRKEFPSMKDEDIATMFPELKDILHML